MEHRRFRIGSSDAPTILGVNKYQTVDELLKRKSGILPDLVKNKAMLRGTYLEEPIARYITDTTDYKLHEIDTVIHKQYDFIVANIDRVVFADGIQIPVEIKCPSSRTAASYMNNTPEMYIIQVMHQIMCMDAPYGYILVFDADKWDYRISTIPRNDELISVMVEAEIGFYNKLTDMIKETI